MVRLYQRLARR